MVTPEFKCRLLLKQHDVAVFSSNYALYGDMSSRVMATLAALAPEIEVYSIDEAFLDMSSFSRFDLPDYARQMRRKVRLHGCASICTSRSFGRNVSTLAELQQAVATFAGKCAVKLRKEDSLASLPTVFIATSPFDDSGGRYWGTRTAALQLPTQDSIAILQAAETILAGIFRDGKVYKKAGNIDKPMLATTSKNGGQSSWW